MGFLSIFNVTRSLTGHEKMKSMYLLRYWPDEAHILQFCRSDEYFETPEYELLTPLGLRDIF